MADTLIDRLQHWWTSLPLYLKPGCPTAPSNVRAIAYLSLRYYYVVLLVTRPYLLQAVTEDGFADPRASHRIELCEKANRESIILLRDLARQGLVSSINYFDAIHILTNGMILFLRCFRNQSLEAITELEQYMPLLSLTHHLNIGKLGKQSIEALVEKLKSTCEQQRYVSSLMIVFSVSADA